MTWTIQRQFYTSFASLTYKQFKEFATDNELVSSARNFFRIIIAVSQTKCVPKVLRGRGQLDGFQKMEHGISASPRKLILLSVMRNSGNLPRTSWLVYTCPRHDFSFSFSKWLLKKFSYIRGLWGSRSQWLVIQWEVIHQFNQPVVSN